jgi:hypothetical protein
MDATRELFERLGETPVERGIQPAVDADVAPETAEALFTALWQTWVVTTYHMVRLGFAQRDLCDAAAAITTYKEEAIGRSREGV